MHAGTGEGMRDRVVPAGMMRFLWALVSIPLLLGSLVFVFHIPDDQFRFLGNTAEGVVALICMICCLYAWRTWSERVILILAAFAFGGYALSNTFWFLYQKVPQETGASFSIADLGFIGFMLIFIVAFRIEFQKTPCPVAVRIIIGALFALVALLALGNACIPPDTALISSSTICISLNTVPFALLLLIIALFIDAALDHGVYRYSLLWSGTCLWCFVLFLYGARETFVDPIVALVSKGPGPETGTFLINPLQLQDFLHVIGPLVILSFILIQLGIFAYLNTTED
jgi:hypothetical protein